MHPLLTLFAVLLLVAWLARTAKGLGRQAHVPALLVTAALGIAVHA